MAIPPGHQKFVDDIVTLLSYPPPFIYINDPTTLRVTSSVLNSVLSQESSLRFAHIDAIATYTPRLVFDTIINALAGWSPDWDAGCANWSNEGGVDNGGEGGSYNASLGGFMRGLRDVRSEAIGKGKAKASDESNFRMVIVIDNAERLKETLPSLVVPLSRLAELSQLESSLSVIFLSCVRWEDIRPSAGASPDPFFIDINPTSKDDIAQFLESEYLRICNDTPCDAYSPPLLPLYKQFVSAVVSVSFPFTHDPYELSYAVAAQWPHFVQAALNEAASEGEGETSGVLPKDQTRMRLLRSFTASMTTAFEALYPREMHAADWLESPGTNASEGASHSMLPRMHKFILLASFIASANPAKSDLRMFGRGLDEKGRRKRKGGGTRQGSGKVAKVPQRLLGPSAFPLDRLLAILGALLEENDVDDRLPLEEEMNVPGEWTDMEVGRVGVLASISELTSMRLLHRTTPVEKLDGPPMFKCGITYETALGIARELSVPLVDLLWETA